jgi:NTE family protein
MANIININNDLDNKICKILSKYNKNIDKSIKNLVLSGGGVKGYASVAVLQELYDNNLLNNVTTIASTSIGSVISAMYCIGYSFNDIQKVFLSLDISNMMSPDPTNIIEDYSLDNGEKIEFVLNKIFESKNLKKTITLKEVYEISKIKQIITATCLNDSQVYYFSHTSDPDMMLITLIRMSTAVPIIFKPIIYNNKMFIDGGIIDNYPIHLFNDDMDRTLGIYLKDKCEYHKDINNIETFMLSVIQCVIKGHNFHNIKNYEKNTIILDLPYVSLMQKQEDKIKNQMISIGKEECKKYIKSLNLK